MRREGWKEEKLNETLIQHSVGNFKEAGNVSTVNVVSGIAKAGSGVNAIVMDSNHNLMQSFIDFFSLPWEAHAILSHFET